MNTLHIASGFWRHSNISSLYMVILVVLGGGANEIYAEEKTAIKETQSSSAEEIASLEQPSHNTIGWEEKFANFFKPVKWKIKPIPVCWENPIGVEKKILEWIRESIIVSWEKKSYARFSGWEKCAPWSKSSKGIRVYFADERPRTKGLGKELNGVRKGITLNVSFNNFLPNICSQLKNKKKCIRSSVIHEFGHALGFAHEQNRPDTPKWCKDMGLEDERSGNWTSKVWDKDSVMDYCAWNWPGPQNLSHIDGLVAKRIYGSPVQ